jgi:hypothetical protein
MYEFVTYSMMALGYIALNLELLFTGSRPRDPNVETAAQCGISTLELKPRPFARCSSFEKPEHSQTCPVGHSESILSHGNHANDHGPSSLVGKLIAFPLLGISVTPPAHIYRRIHSLPQSSFIF